jgi:hypothetical protein
MAKISLDSIKEELEQDGWKVISDTYTNLETEMRFECPEGHAVFAPWKRLRAKRICPTCEANVYKTEAATSKIVPKKKNVFRVLALDQATYITGFSIFDDKELIKYGTYQTQLPDTIARSNAVKVWLVNMLHNWQPDLVALENIQLQNESEGKRMMGVDVFQQLAWLQGILIECCFELGIAYTLCHTGVWRQECGVKGRTRSDRKSSMRLLAKQWYDVSVSEDEADAIGIGTYAVRQCAPNRKMISWE